MPNPDAQIAGPPVMLEMHPFDFLAAEVRQADMLVSKLADEQTQARKERDLAVQKLNEFVQRAAKP